MYPLPTISRLNPFNQRNYLKEFSATDCHM
jgi:hypothetical protein